MNLFVCFGIINLIGTFLSIILLYWKSKINYLEELEYNFNLKTEERLKILKRVLSENNFIIFSLLSFIPVFNWIIALTTLLIFIDHSHRYLNPITDKINNKLAKKLFKFFER
jgi:uncharacterized membrane protein YdjX (TVP38/TMEM64 family)